MHSPKLITQRVTLPTKGEVESPPAYMLWTINHAYQAIEHSYHSCSGEYLCLGFAMLALLYKINYVQVEKCFAYFSYNIIVGDTGTLFISWNLISRVL